MRRKRFFVGRNDRAPFKDSTGRTWTRRRFATHDEAAEYIGSLPDKEAVKRGEYYLDPPEDWNGD